MENVALVSRYEASLEAANPGDPAARALRAWLAVARGVERFRADPSTAEHPGEFFDALFFVERANARVRAAVF